MSRSRGSKSPKYIALAEQIRSQIKSGVLRPGDRLPTFVEMCAQHDVTPTTVTNVYSLLQRERLIVCERGRGSFVAAPPPKKLTGIIGVSGLGYMQHPFSAGLMRGFAGAAAKSGTELLLLDESSLLDETSAVQWGRMDGLITHGMHSSLVLERLPADMPSVAVMVSLPDAVCVVADERGGISALIQHLISLGHQRIAALFDLSSPRRISAYRDALYTAGIEVNPKWMRPAQFGHGELNPYAEDGYKVVQQWLREDWDSLGCTAIVTQNDDTAHGAIEALRQAGKRVPEEVSVTGFDGTEVGSYSRPSLTTVEVPLEEIGATAVELLQRQIAGEDLRCATLVLPVSLRIRESTTGVCLGMAGSRA